MNNQNIKNLDDNISIAEIIDFFRESWKQIVLGGMVGGAIGVSVTLIKPPIYQATAYIQVARVANVDVETPNILLEKLKCRCITLIKLRLSVELISLQSRAKRSLTN